MSKLFLSLAGGLLLSLSASAGTLTSFSTVGTLACGSAVNCTVVGGNLQFSSSGSAVLQIAYAPGSATNLNVDATPQSTNTNFGVLSLTCLNCAGQTATFNINNATLAILLTQSPNPFVASGGGFGTATFTGTLNLNNGQFGGAGGINFSSQQVTYSNSSVNVNYRLATQAFPPNSYTVSIGNNTTLQGFIQTSPVPEPSTNLLIGAGAVALSLVMRRRRG